MWHPKPFLVIHEPLPTTNESQFLPRPAAKPPAQLTDGNLAPSTRKKKGPAHPKRPGPEPFGAFTLGMRVLTFCKVSIKGRSARQGLHQRVEIRLLRKRATLHRLSPPLPLSLNLPLDRCLRCGGLSPLSECFRHGARPSCRNFLSLISCKSSMVMCSEDAWRRASDARFQFSVLRCPISSCNVLAIELLTFPFDFLELALEFRVTDIRRKSPAQSAHLADLRPSSAPAFPLEPNARRAS